MRKRRIGNEMKSAAIASSGKTSAPWRWQTADRCHALRRGNMQKLDEKRYLYKENGRRVEKATFANGWRGRASAAHQRKPMA